MLITVQYVERVRGGDGDPAGLSPRQRLEFHRSAEASLKVVPSGREPFVLPRVAEFLDATERTLASLKANTIAVVAIGHAGGQERDAYDELFGDGRR